MLIYDKSQYRFSYSNINRNVMACLMSDIRKCILTYHGIWGNTAHINLDRVMFLGIRYSIDKHDFFIENTIYSRCYLPLISNHSPLYEIDRRYPHLQFRKGLYCIPLTFTSSFLYDSSNYDRYKNLTVSVYEKKMKVKLGFCGSHLDKHKITPIMDKW